MTIAPKYPLTWDLDCLLPHPETDEFRKCLATFRQDLERLAEQSAVLPAIDEQPETAAVWVQFLEAWESVTGRGSDLGSFVGCHAASDAEEKLFQQTEAQLSALEPLQEQIATNLEFALKEASDEALDAFVGSDAQLREIEFFLRDRRRRAEFRLPREQELLAAELGVDGIHAWGRLYDRVSGELRVQVMERGEIVEKSASQVQFDSPQRSVRENNFFAANAAWNHIADTCADAVNHIAGTRLTLYRRLGLRDHLEVPCRLNRMGRAALDAMWSAVSERKACLLPYMQKKAEAFGLERLAWYDITAPYPCAASSTQTAEISYDDACDRIIQTFQGFSSELGDFARRAVENRWVEAENRSGKRQGGFCTDFPTKKQSRIFMTFTDSTDSMSTLAHELGHAYHSFVLRDRPFFLRDYPMNLAETASTFAEAVLGEQRLTETESVSGQLEILDAMLSDAVSYLMNIHARFVFEDSFYRRRAEGEVPAEELSTMMLDAQKVAYLDALADGGWNPSFWISKLHFYISGWPFYNFPYTFGYLLSLGVYALGAEGSDDFPEQYRQLLIATGCQDTEDAVQSTLGYDLTNVDFWNKSLDIVQRRVDRFLDLAVAQ
jgi:pepF/M3 family oligoendopeptidase